MTGRFALVDLLVLLAYLLGTTIFGMWIGRSQRSANDYFVAERAIPWWAVLFSIVASETSALTFISIPGLAYIGDLGYLQVVMGYIIGRIAVSYTLLPRYFEGNLVTAYALLETRFGLTTRRFTSIVFMGTRGLADAVRVFATAIPVALIIGPALPERYAMPVSILVLGLLTVLYTYKGGMKTVVWTELIQASIYVFGGIMAVRLIGQSVDGGWSTIIARAGAAEKTQLISWYTGFDQPHTIFAGLLGGAFLAMASHGADQLIVQRLLSSRSLSDARRALIGSGFVVFAQFTLFLMVGLGLWVLFEGRPFAAADQIFPTFIIERMPHGLLGLIVAAIVAATMSTHSGTINALAAATTHDIYLPITGRSPDDPRTLKVGKLFALIWGLVLTFGALLFKAQGTPVVVIALSIASFTYGGLLGGFFLGLFWDRANQRDAIIGMSVGIATMGFIVFAKQLIAAFPELAASGAPTEATSVLADTVGPSLRHLTATTLRGFASIAWPWYVLIGTSLTFATGVLSSFTHPAPTEAPRFTRESRS